MQVFNRQVLTRQVLIGFHLLALNLVCGLTGGPPTGHDDRRNDRRSQRGSISLELAVIGSALLIIALAVAAAVKYDVYKYLPGTN